MVQVQFARIMGVATLAPADLSRPIKARKTIASNVFIRPFAHASLISFTRLGRSLRHK